MFTGGTSVDSNSFTDLQEKEEEARCQSDYLPQHSNKAELDFHSGL